MLKYNRGYRLVPPAGREPAPIRRSEGQPPMFPMDRRPTQVTVEYDSRRGRVVRVFPNEYQARQFFVQQDKLSRSPTVTRSDPMSTVATESAAPKKAPRKKASRKKPTTKAEQAKKKAPRKKPTTKKAKKEGGSRGVSPLQSEVLKVLRRNVHGLTRSQISEKLPGKWIGCELMGHTNPEKINLKSLLGMGMVRIECQETPSGGTSFVYILTAKGKTVI